LENTLIIAGFGGQGVMLIGQLLGYSATYADQYATWFPSYGPEQRGGTANCSVVISDTEIGSPIISKADVIIVMNEPSLTKFEPMVKENGTIIVNSSLATSRVTRKDIKAIYIPVNEMAEELGSAKVANIIMLGAYIGLTKAISVDIVLSTIKEKMGKRPEMYTLNRAALDAGIKRVS